MFMVWGAARIILESLRPRSPICLGNFVSEGKLQQKLDMRPVDEIKARMAFGKIADPEEHTSELQSLMRISYAVFCLKKKNNKTTITCITNLQKFTTHVI